MRIKFPRYLTASLSVFFIFICSFTHGQTKGAKEALENADRLYVKEKFEDARTLYLQHAANLSPAQQMKLGAACMATSGKNPERVAESISWIEKAAAAGNTEAMNTLSYCYGNGVGVSKDPALEIQWLSKSADHNDENALVTLGFRYETGVGVESNITKATELYRRAANRGNARAAFQLGAIEGYDNPSLSARDWLRKAANGKYLPAMLKLGEVYERDGNPDEAVRWYTKMKAIKGYTTEHQVAVKRTTAIGRVEPATDINVVKPLLMQLLGAAANNYHSLLRRETEPLTGNRVDVLSTSTYYTSTLDVGFKNALIRKEVVQARDLGNIKINAGTHYSYSADIVHSVTEETALRVFEKWVTLLKAIIPEWKGYRNQENSSRPLFTISGNMTNGKEVVLRLSVSGANSDKVGFSISNR
jgi:TPR repeat protein